ncbi:inter-alpha-trypsin inhibitor heavy chain H3 [Elysia marginata]|uniref:Inter-alpha-trypsin inhibitor heavy chain H3 n=1 Tax=Elysia marginata TaxID=1093978 RepID=A0AAV4GUV6_9GAST|nr:inter-alpha-trypsin inhibitor heavy chain H3 [Elysia marginata]
MRLKVKNNDHNEQAIGFDLTLLKEEFITKLQISVNDTGLKTSFTERSMDEMKPEESIDLSNSAVHLNLASESKYGTLYHVSVNVPCFSVADFNVTSLRLLQRQNDVYRLEVYVKFESEVRAFFARIGVFGTNTLKIWRDSLLRPVDEENVYDITRTGTYRQESKSYKYFEWNIPVLKNRSRKKTLRWSIVYTIFEHRDKLGFCMISETNYFFHFLNARLRSTIRKDVILALDRSGSMFSERMIKLKQAIFSILKKSKLRRKEIFYNILSYGETVRKVWSGLRKPSKVNNKKAQQFVSSMDAYGMSDVFLALKDALAVLNKKPADSQGMIVFLTDGIPSAGEENMEKIVTDITSLNTGNYPIFSLAFGNGTDLRLLTSLSANNFGFVRRIYETKDADKQIRNAFEEVTGVSLKDVKVKYEEGNTQNVTTRSCPFLLSKTDHFITGCYTGNRTSFLYEVQGVKTTKRKFTWKSKNFCKMKSNTKDFNNLAEQMWAYQQLQELLWENARVGIQNRHIRETRISAIKQLGLTYKFVTVYTTIEVQQLKSAGQRIQTATLQQIDLDLMTPIEFTFWKPYYPIRKVKFSNKLIPPPTEKPASEKRKQVKRGDLHLLTMKFQTPSTFFSNGNGFCIAPRQWSTGTYKLFQIKPDGLKISFYRCSRKCSGKPLNNFQIKNNQKTLIVYLRDSHGWPKTLKTRAEDAGFQATLEDNMLELHLSGRLKIIVRKDAKQKPKQTLHWFHLEIFPSSPYSTNQFAGVLGTLSNYHGVLKKSKKSKLCKTAAQKERGLSFGIILNTRAARNLMKQGFQPDIS